MTNKFFSIRKEFSNSKTYKVVNVAGLKLRFKTKNKTNNSYNTVHYMVAMLKAFNIKHIVTSPGRQNSLFNALVQNDDFFKCYSVVDERSAAYVATGIAYETNEPVVITCTGATASRNYLSALTEAYYRKLPIIALTFVDYNANIFNLQPQFVDRSISQNDIKNISVDLPRINDDSDKKRLMLYINAALIEAVNKKSPVHINCPSYFNYDTCKENLPEDIWTTKYYEYNFQHLVSELQNKKMAIFIGAHSKFDKMTEDAISDFALSYNVPVFCDHTSNYHGKNKILITQFSTMKNKNLRPEIVIDIGSVCGDYNLFRIFTEAKIWRVSEDSSFKSRLNVPVEYLFNCNEIEFFKALLNKDSSVSNYYNEVENLVSNYKVPELDLSNPLVCYELSKRLPKNSSLHLAILNSLRSMNYFKLDESIDVISNVGGFGIDGPLSTLIGQSFTNSQKLFFCVTGDLAFFYDMNILGQRDIGKNLRILVVNNNKGIEFRLNNELEKSLADDTDKYIAAGGHYKGGLKSWAESCGFAYLYSDSEENLIENPDKFCSLNNEKPIIFEVKTTNKAEQMANKLMLSFNK